MPKVGRFDDYIEAGVRVAEYGLEYLTYANVGAMCGVSGQAVSYHFKDHGGFEGFKAAVIGLAEARRNPFVVGQIKARRKLPDGWVVETVNAKQVIRPAYNKP